MRSFLVVKHGPGQVEGARTGLGKAVFRQVDES